MVSLKRKGNSQTDKKFRLVSPYQPAGDQAKVIKEITDSIRNQNFEQTILGATGTGKTFMMASIIQNIQKPTLVIAHNKTLAAQLAEEFKRFFPENAVHYFVSYYDYYQPESYIPRTDTYIEKQTQINEEIERLRNATTQALLTRKDVLIVASVSCIYGLGDPEDFKALKIELETGKTYILSKILTKLVDMQFERTTADLSRGKFRLRGDTLEIYPTGEDKVGYRFSFFGDELEKIQSFDIITGSEISEIDFYTVFPAKQYVTTQEKIRKAVVMIEKDLFDRVAYFESQNQLLQAQRLKDRTANDIEMLQTLGYVGGIENYSIYFDNRSDGQPPSTLVDYFPDDSLCFIDESHMTLSQIAAMYNGDRSRKQSLIEYGFRLPSSLNNRPLKINEFFEKSGQLIYVSATPGDFELGKNNFIGKEKIFHRDIDARKKMKQKLHENIVVSEALIRPTGLLDPEIILKPVENQVDDVLEQVRQRVSKGQRVLITTLTKKFAEELDMYFKQISVKSAYIHSDVETLDRVEILSQLRRGKFDVLIGINLLREGLDLPEVSLVAIFDADKEGFLRSKTSLIQIIGRAARHQEGKVIMYADTITSSMQYAIDETNRRRKIQQEYNRVHGITPTTTHRDLESLTDSFQDEVEKNQNYEKPRAAYTPGGFELLDEFIEVGKTQNKKRNKSVFGFNKEKFQGRPKKGKQVYQDFETTKESLKAEITKDNLTREELKELMHQASLNMEFEKAAAIKDLLGI